MLLDDTFTPQFEIVQSLNRLAGVLGKRKVQHLYPAFPMAIAILRGISEENKRDEAQNLALLAKAGEIPKISEELYNPSFDDQMGDYLSPSKYPSPVTGEQQFFTVPELELGCLLTYNLYENGACVAMIKNYVHLDVIDYSATSLMYPVVVTEAMSSTAFVTGGRLGGTVNNRDDMISTAYFMGAAYPLTVAYRALNTSGDEATSSATFLAAYYPLIVTYEAYSYTDDGVNAQGSFLAAYYPLIVNYITLNHGPESVGSQGIFNGASRP